MKEEEDYLTCGKCMTEFRLDNITSFINHKKHDCREPDQELTNDLQAELVCSSCPQGFMTAVGLLKHAQTIHKFKLFFERSASITGIERVEVSPIDDTGQLTIQNFNPNKGQSKLPLNQSNALLNHEERISMDTGQLTIQNFNLNKGQSNAPLNQSNTPLNHEERISLGFMATEKTIVPRQQLSPIKTSQTLPVNSEERTSPIFQLNQLEVLKSGHKTPNSLEQRTLSNANQILSKKLEQGTSQKSNCPENPNFTAITKISPPKQEIPSNQPQSINSQQRVPQITKSNKGQIQGAENIKAAQLTTTKCVQDLRVPVEPSMPTHDKTIPVKVDSIGASLSSRSQKNLPNSVLNAIVKSGVILPVMNKQSLDVPVSTDLAKVKDRNILMGMNENKQENGHLLNLQLTEPNTGKQSTHTEGQVTTEKPSFTGGQVTTPTIDCVKMSEQRILKLPVKFINPSDNKSSSTKSSVLLSTLDNGTSSNSLTDSLNPMTDIVKDNQSTTETPETIDLIEETSTSDNAVNIDDTNSSETSNIVCCDSQKCGVTVIPGTHEGLKECCNAVIPKKRKRHFETKHTLSGRQKLSRRMSGTDLSKQFRTGDYLKRKSGTIFIDLEPNDSETLSTKSSMIDPLSTDDNEIGFQVSGLRRENTSSLQGKPKGKGSVILQPGAIYSIPIAYSLTTQTDGSLRPLVISKRTFLSEPTSVITSVANGSKTVSETHTVISEDDLPDNLSERSTGLSVDSKSQSDIINQSRRRRYPTSRPFKCDKCDSAFNQRIHLKKHMSKHTGEKPFKCQQCNYSTVERSHLKVHIRIHTGEKPFKCTYCEYATAQNSTLKIHLKRHHKPSQGTVSMTMS